MRLWESQTEGGRDDGKSMDQAAAALLLLLTNPTHGFLMEILGHKAEWTHETIGFLDPGVYVTTGWLQCCKEGK